MKYELAQANIAKFILPQEHPDNADFINNLDRVNAIAESQEGFIWRFTGDGNDAMDVKAFDDPSIALNMSVWDDPGSLADFVYRNQDHRDIMRRRKEWFDKIEFYMVLWWVEEGRRPTPEEAKIRLDLLKCLGPSYAAFTFKKSFAAPNGEILDAFS